MAVGNQSSKSETPDNPQADKLKGSKRVAGRAVSVIAALISSDLVSGFESRFSDFITWINSRLRLISSGLNRPRQGARRQHGAPPARGRGAASIPGVQPTLAGHEDGAAGCDGAEGGVPSDGPQKLPAGRPIAQSITHGDAPKLTTTPQG